jgi:hypothetical protein
MDRDTLLRFTTTGWDYVFIEEPAGRAKARSLHASETTWLGYVCRAASLWTFNCRLSTS